MNELVLDVGTLVDLLTPTNESAELRCITFPNSVARQLLSEDSSSTSSSSSSSLRPETAN